MPNYNYGIFVIQLRTNEHNHKKQRAHVHIYLGGSEKGSMFLDGTVREGCGGLSRKIKKLVVETILLHSEEYQSLWDKYQSSDY